MNIKNNPVISVIMPAYNCEMYIRRAIESILNQTYTNFELLISDDESKDLTKEIIGTYNDNRIRVYHNQKNLGYVQTCNKLASFAKGDFITFQDADDWSELNRFELLIDKFSTDENLSCIGSFVNVVDGDGSFIKQLEYKLEHEGILNSMLTKKIDCFNSSMMFKRKVYDKVGLYNLYFDRIGSEDYYWFGLVVSNFKVANIAYGLYNYRINPTSFSREKLPAPKKQMSGEFATLFFRYYFKTKTEIFTNSYNLKVIEWFLLGKCSCWRGNVRQGIAMLIKSILYNPFGLSERYSLIRIYFPKLIK
jgi:glycosyltransferase involved in cell wall biosynthesis